MEQKHFDSGYVGAKLVGVSLVCNIFFVASYYIHHKYRVAPKESDTLEELDTLIRDTYVRENDCVIIAGDFNCQL